MVLGRFGWFWVVPCFSNYDLLLVNSSSENFEKCYHLIWDQVPLLEKK